MTTLDIDRGQWLTGTAHKIVGDSGLCKTDQNLMCCLGFLGKAKGYALSQLRQCSVLSGFEHFAGVLSPLNWLTRELDAKDRKRFKVPTAESALVDVNDSFTMHPTRRESAIQYLFKKYGDIDVTFSGRYADATAKARVAQDA